MADGPPAYLFEELKIGMVVPIVRHTFIHIPICQAGSETSGQVQSAPCASLDVSAEREPPNPRGAKLSQDFVAELE